MMKEMMKNHNAFFETPLNKQRVIFYAKVQKSLHILQKKSNTEKSKKNTLKNLSKKIIQKTQKKNILNFAVKKHLHTFALQ